MNRIFRCIVLLIVLQWIIVVRVLAQSCDSSCGDVDECKSKIEKCQEAWNAMQAAKAPHVDALKKMESDIATFKTKIAFIELDLTKKAAAIDEGEKELAALVDAASRRIAVLYRRTSSYNPLIPFFSSTNVGAMLRAFTYQEVVINEDKKSIAATAVSIQDLETRKKKLESQKAILASLKSETDKRAADVRKLVNEANAYQSKVSGIIASLTALQQAILNARGGTFTTSVGDVPLADDPNSAPNFNPGFSPAFAAFSFGAYTHRKGMSQYGAKGRAQSGQNSSQILQAYYGKAPVNKDTAGSISVSGYGSMEFEGRYLYGIAEMPADFPKEALKAQAIAARSYAYRYKAQGQAICTTQSCQVYNNGKASNPPQAWKDAVNETRGQVIEDVVTYYSSTTGGWGSPGGWDTKCGSQSCWTGDAYEKIAGSPWFYKGWYTSDYFNNSAKCNKSHPWLTLEEFADILNGWIILKNGSAEDAKRVVPITINSCSIGGQTGNPFSMTELREKANSLGGAVTSVSSVSVTYNSGGYTDSVIINTNKGELRISGADFVQAYNIRAPGYISIRGVLGSGVALFNIEKK